MEKIIYNSIGTNYNSNRAADSRIIETINNLLNLPHGSTIADIGAGTGNYSNAFADLGYNVYAIEPSEEMRGQAKFNKNVTWLSGTAESIPLKDDSVKGVIVVLAIHHFSSLQCAAVEMHRICPAGPIVVFTFDPRQGETPWFNDYFPQIYQQDYTTFPPIDRVSEKIALDKNWSKTIKSFPLPHDLSDKNMYSAWQEPERYLDAQFRKNTSGLALAPESEVQNGVKRLENDLHTGKWDQKYGYLRGQKFFDPGFKFIQCRLHHSSIK